MGLDNITSKKPTWCPNCKNKTEKKFRKWFDNKYKQYTIKHQPKYDWCKNSDTDKFLPFDFVIEDLKLIIEIDGDQHFIQVLNWASPEDTLERDIYKMKMAFKNGYKIIRIIQTDIYYDKNEWEKKFDEELTKTILNNTTSKDDTIGLICIGCDVKYSKLNDIIGDNTNTDIKKYKCDKCDSSFRFKSHYDKHCETELHKTGKKKERSDKLPDYKCTICNSYITNLKSNYELHILNNHKTFVEREKEFKFFCKICNKGYMDKTLYDTHIETRKHITKDKILKSNQS